MAQTVLHYLNTVAGDEPGFRGETWIPHADEPEEGPAALPPVAGRDGILVSPKAGDALVFFSFTDDGDKEVASLHGGRPASETKWVGNQWIRLTLDRNDVLGNEHSELPRGPGFGPRVVS